MMLNGGAMVGKRMAIGGDFPGPDQPCIIAFLDPAKISQGTRNSFVSLVDSSNDDMAESTYRRSADPAFFSGEV